ncbi:ABC transporter substrate-binding protein [Devosia geojensis]|uniref:ABC transporter substrate-binding protein n=1 Tax=Devosia geojensis TaxID=443610 RepID=UPI001364C8BE|nr:extracellular solute-binding protein [Devosia geojensis]
MKLWTKGLAALALGVALATPALAQEAATGAATPNTEISGTISVWTWPNNDRTFAALMPTFNAAYPNITVNVQGFPNANDAYLNNLQRALLSGSGPDVAMIEIAQLALLRERPQWVDLAQAPYNAGEFIEDFAPFTVSNVTLPDGKIVALPKHTGPGGMFYRRDIFEEAGLPTDPAEVAELLSDWDAFIEEGKKLVVPNERWLIGNGEEILRAMIAQTGISYFDAEGNLQFDQPVFREALERVREAGEAGLISPFTAWSPEWQGAFQRGQLATVLYGNWFGGLLKRAYATDQSGQWAVAAAPGTEGNRSFNSGGDYIGILETSQNKEAAWAFVHWLVTNDESLKQQYQNDDLYPAYMPALEQDWMNFADPYYGEQNVNEIFAPVQAELIPVELDARDTVAIAAMRTAINNVARGVATVDEALAAAKAEVEARM